MPILRGFVVWFIQALSYVNKARHLLAQNNIKSCVVKLQATQERRGCGYGIEVRESFFKSAISIIEKYKIKIVEIIREN